jgi:GDP-L-fucose synthase
MDHSAKIYVAGHRGMVGSAIVRHLHAAGYTNIIVRTHDELDLTRQVEVESFFQHERPDYVFLAAAKVGGIIANNTYRAEFIRDNLAIALNVIDAAYRSGVRRLLNLGSSCIYPKFAEQPLREESLLTGALESTNEPYAIAKIAAIKLCRYYNEQFSTDYISLMPTNLYGPYDNFNFETAHVLPALLRKFHLARLLRENNLEAVAADLQRYRLGFGIDDDVDLSDFTSIQLGLERVGVTEDAVMLWGTGSPYREFLHVDDLASAALYLSSYSYHEIGEMVNVGTGTDRTIAEIAEMVRTATGFEGEISYDRTKPDGTPRKLLDVSRIHALGWNHSIPFREGIEQTVAWYRSDVGSDVVL